MLSWSTMRWASEGALPAHMVAQTCQAANGAFVFSRLAGTTPPCS
jgi:hypothetical protein